MIAYKFLRPGGISPFARHPWPLPSNGGTSAWVEADGDLRVCERAVHGCGVADLPLWLDAELWQIELDGAIATDHGKLAARRGRIIARIDAWTPQMAGEYALACAERTRQRAVVALRRAGDDAAAAAVEAASTRPELRDAVSGMDEASVPGRAAAFALDAARYAGEAAGDASRAVACAATAAYIAVTAAVDLDGAAAAGHERGWQAAWLAERLGLPYERSG